MFKSIGKVSALVAGLALAACGSDGAGTSSGTGSVKFDLKLPDGQDVSSINLNITCPASNVNQNHVLNVTKGEVVASFGGLAPGACTATLATAQASDGTDCAGSAQFTVVANQNTDVLVTLICQARNASPNGSAKISTKFEKRDCSTDRIKKVFAIPANVLLGESTLVEVETYSTAIVGTAKYSWAVRNTATHTATGPLAAGSCSPTSASCQTFTCGALGAAVSTDARTGFPVASAFVSVTLEDDNCFDTEEVWVDCLQASKCGDGQKTGVEECDDGNTASNDGCSATCVVEKCGDGIIQTGEVCDGTVGVTPPNTCAADCKSINVAPRCGDGVVNQASEQCDGTAGLLPGQVCSATCQIVPTCGNGVKEGAEECDDGNTVNTDACSNACKTVATDPLAACKACVTALPDIGDFNTTLCNGDALCVAARDCVLAAANKSCWGTIASAACYCGDSQADIDACEQPTFSPKGRCAATLRAGAGAGATNQEVLQRYFDPAFPTGVATIVLDGAFTSSCKATCF